jgi:hypothetical protein
MAIRVAHWGTGGTGRAGLRGIIGHPQLELVGLFVQRPENVGRDAGEIVGLADTGIKATNSVEEILALKPDCLAYYGDGVGQSQIGIDNVVRFLEAGINVVSTSFASLVHPKFAPDAQRIPIEQACQKGGTSFFCSGIEPGFASDLIPMALLTCVERLDSLRVSEISTYAYYPVEHVQRVVFGFGEPLSYEPPLFQGDRITQTWGPVVRGMAEMVGVELDGLRQWHEFATTSVNLDTAFGEVKAGTRSAVRMAVEGMYAGEPIVALEHVNYLSDELPDHWPRPVLGNHSVYRTEIKGRPQVKVEAAFDLIDGEEQAIIATAVRVVNAIPGVVAARPGPLDPHEIPMSFSGHVRKR